MIRIPGRIPISIQPLFWLVAFFIGAMSTANIIQTLFAVVAIAISVLFHEFGHALTAIVFGQKTRIELAAFGGFTYREGRKLKLWEEFIVVFNGPLAGFIIGVIAWMFYRHAAIENANLLFVVRFTAIVNFYWTVINLFPVLPLDGGHLLSIILEAIFGVRGVKWALYLGIVFSCAVCIFFFIIKAFIAGAIFLLLTFESFRALRYYKLMSHKDRDADLQQEFRSAQQDFDEGNHVLALEKLEGVRNKAQEGILYTMATQQIAEIYREQSRYKEGYEILLPIKKTLSGESLTLFQYLAFANEDYETVTHIASECFQVSPSYETAILNALSHGALNQAEPAVGWLDCALREGLTNVESTLQRKELDPIRQHPRFQEFLQSLKEK